MPWQPRRAYTPIEKNLIHTFTLQQKELRKSLVFASPKYPIEVIAGCDSAFIDDKILSVFVLFDRLTLEQIEVVSHLAAVQLPYIPGFLAFREIPNLMHAYKKLQHKPDLIMVDGHGIMHPRRMGIASHLGIELAVPTIGVAKKKLVGVYEEPGPMVGDTSFVMQKEETIGVALRSKHNVKPIFVSPGNLCDLSTAIRLVEETLRGYKLPEPTRIADMYSKELKPRLPK